MVSSAVRIVQRYLVPKFVVSIYHLLRSGASVSASARVQLTSKIAFGKATVVKALAVVQTSGGAVRLGRHCALSSFDHISTGDGDVVIGDYVRIAPNCTLVGGTKAIAPRGEVIVDQPEVVPNGIVIGDDVLIGAGTVVLPATNIGRGVVIGAGSVVQGDIPDYAIAAGRPAKVIGERKP